MQIGTMSFELERRLDAELHSHRRVLSALNQAMRTATNFDEFKVKFDEEVRGAELQDFFVGEARRAIESGSEEFATPDAVIEQPSTGKAHT